MSYELVAEKENALGSPNNFLEPIIMAAWQTCYIFGKFKQQKLSHFESHWGFIDLRGLFALQVMTNTAAICHSVNLVFAAAVSSFKFEL